MFVADGPQVPRRTSRMMQGSRLKSRSGGGGFCVWTQGMVIGVNLPNDRTNRNDGKVRERGDLRTRSEFCSDGAAMPPKSGGSHIRKTEASE
jgi:hypothetical protein